MINKEKVKLVWHSSPPLSRCMYHVKIIKLYFQKELTTLIPSKYNHKSTKEINLLPSSRLSKTLLLSKFFVTNEKIDKFS